MFYMDRAEITDVLNKGAVPFYYKWPLELSLADSSGSLIIKAITSADITT